MTMVGFLAVWALTAWLIGQGYLIAVVLTLPAAGFLLRIFTIQHDCGHNSFFSSMKVNNWVGRAMGAFTLTPYSLWKHAHNLHHKSSGNLQRRGIGDVKTLTRSEYESLSAGQRLKYRLYRHPVIMFGLGPAYVFLLDHRLPFGRMQQGWGPWISTMGTNLSVLALASLAIWLVGWQTFLIVQVPITLIAATAGVWLFFIQHQFEDMQWEHEEEWSFHESALHGSSHYDLPQPLRWFTANIGLHHIHHLSSRIPYYRLTEVLKDYPMLHDVNRLTLWESFRCVPLALWDEDAGMMRSFRQCGY